MYRIDQDEDTKYYYVFPTSFSESGKWVVAFSNAKDAETYKSYLMSGQVKSPMEAPDAYKMSGKYYQGKTTIYNYTRSLVQKPQYKQKMTRS